MKSDRPNIPVIHAVQPVASQRRRQFQREVLTRSQLRDRDFSPSDELEQHCLRADRVYSRWAFESTPDTRWPEA